MRNDYLYSNFLVNKNVYNLNEGFWTKTLKKIVNGVCDTNGASEGFKKWFKTEFSNAKKFYDANPIFSALCESQNKAIRIIQETPEMDVVEISAWVDAVEIDEGKQLDELVISLELSKESKLIAEKLIKFWIKEDTDREKMNFFIDRELSECGLN